MLCIYCHCTEIKVSRQLVEPDNVWTLLDLLGLTL